MKIRHAFTGHTYERLDDDRVEVVDPVTGLRGIFDSQARWLSGDLKYADFHLCGAVGGSQPTGQRVRS